LKYLVTGYGFVGRYLVDYLSKEPDSEITVIERIVNSVKLPDNVQMVNLDLRHLDRTFEADYVFHLAGVTNVKFAEDNPQTCFEDNVLGTVGLLRHVQVAKRFLFTSTATVYGNPIPSGSLLKEDNPLNTISYYGASKIGAETIIRSVARTKKLPWTIVRFFNLFGKGQGDSYIIPQIIKQLQTDGLVHLRGSRQTKRDYLHVRNAVDAIVYLAGLQESEGEVYNIGSGVGTSIEQLVRYFLLLLHLDLGVDSSTEGRILSNESSLESSFSPRELVADIHKLKATGWKEKLSFIEGLKESL